MRYVDGPTTEVSILIAATPEAVWDVVTDPTIPAEHSQELQSAVWDPDGPEPGLGARILGHNVNPAVGEWRTSSIVTEWDAPNAWGYAVGDDPASAAALWRFTLTQSDDGTTLTQHVRLGPGPSGLTPAIEAMPDKEERIISKRLQFLSENMTANLAAVKARAEAG